MDNNTLAIYTHEMRNQCQYIQAAFELFNNSIKSGNTQGTLYAGQMVLMSASQLAAILWPSRARARNRGETLRGYLKLAEKHPLNDRRLTELSEQADSKLEDWIKSTKGQQIAFDFIGDPAKIGDGITDAGIYRGYNPETRIFWYRGVAYNMQAIAQAVSDGFSRINALYRQLFPEQAKKEDEALRRAQQESRRQQKKAEAARAAEALADTSDTTKTDTETGGDASVDTVAAASKSAAGKPAAKKATPRKTAAKKQTATKKESAKKPAPRRKAPAKKPADATT